MRVFAREDVFEALGADAKKLLENVTPQGAIEILGRLDPGLGGETLRSLPSNLVTAIFVEADVASLAEVLQHVDTSWISEEFARLPEDVVRRYVEELPPTLSVRLVSQLPVSVAARAIERLAPDGALWILEALDFKSMCMIVARMNARSANAVLELAPQKLLAEMDQTRSVIGEARTFAQAELARRQKSLESVSEDDESWRDWDRDSYWR